MELGTELDYNKEIQTVGISNMLSGLCGGYTGSYIFTQTIFNLRGGE
jgi:sulfate permease, SulP family